MPYFLASAFWSAPAWYSLAMAARSALVRRRSRDQGLPFDDRGSGWPGVEQGSGFRVGRSKRPGSRFAWVLT
jgi:hypothetical protein